MLKNAYDADATRVDIRFELDRRPQSIVVEDNGHGMTLNTILNAWFEPGTISKRKPDHSPGGRIYQGAKGIGRFASARLATSLYLESKASGADKGVRVLLEWGSFDETSYLDEIEIDYELVDIPNLEVGTRLTLEGLRKDWTAGDFEDLHSRLSRLISPFQDVQDFTINLLIPGHPEWSGEVQPPRLILEPRYLLRGKLDEIGLFTGELYYGEKFVKSLHQQLGGAAESPLCGPFEIEIRAWDRDREGLDPLVEKLQIGIQEIRRTLNSYCGVSIYRDGFRVYPYGQRGNDWLNLDNRSRQNPVLRLANNQIVAAIKITRENNPGLRDRSTREGMVLNAEHKALEDWFVRVLALLEDYRYDVRPRRQETRTPEPLFEPFDLSEAVRQARTTLGSQHPISSLITNLERQVNESCRPPKGPRRPTKRP